MVNKAESSVGGGLDGSALAQQSRRIAELFPLSCVIRAIWMDEQMQCRAGEVIGQMKNTNGCYEAYNHFHAIYYLHVSR